MEKPDRLNETYALIDRYVMLTFLVRLLTTHSTKSAEEFNSSVYDIDFAELGLSEEEVSDLGVTPTVTMLRKYQSRIIELAEQASVQVFGHLVAFSKEDRLTIIEHVDSKVADYINKIGVCQDDYLTLVVAIDESTKGSDNTTTRELGKKAKASFNRLYEYNTICQNYSNISSYLRGMTKNSAMIK